MNVTRATTVHQLLEAYPYLKDWLTGYAPAFAKLANPILYSTVARAATLEAAASMAEISTETLLEDVRAQIAAHEISAEESRGVTASVPEDERARRQDELKQIILALHDGASVDQVKAQFDKLAAGIDSAEIAAMEQTLIAEGMPPEEIQRLCDVHVSVFKDALETGSLPELEPNHPLAVYMHENEIAARIVDDTRRALVRLVNALTEGTSTEAPLQAVAEHLERIAPVEVHYTRKENQLFPALEAHGVEGPTKVMWGIDDDIRNRLKRAREQLADPAQVETLSRELPEVLLMIDDMIYKEEKILFPTALDALDAEEWETIASGDAQIGYAWIDAPAPWTAPEPCDAEDAAAPAGSSADTQVPLTTGRLDLTQLDVLMRTIPFDLTFVDADDRVAFYSEGDRVFPRSPAVIGREVRNCHPPKSVDKVEAILREFKAGREDTAEFWIELQGRFIHIRYFALRGGAGEYQGCLEVVQDATHVRSLEGQHRLLDW